MIRISILFRFLILALLVMFPGVLIGFALWELRGAALGAGTMIMILCAALFGSEWNLKRISEAESQVPPGLLRSYELTLDGNISGAPHLKIYSDPFPRIFVARSFGGRGTILLSQGMIALMREEDLRLIFGLLVNRARNPAVVFRSFCGTLATWALKFTPKAWKDLVFSNPPFSAGEQKLLTPLSALKSFLPLTLALFFYKLGTIQKSLKSEMCEGQLEALRKLEQSDRFWGSHPTHGVLSFYLSASQL